MIFLCLAVGLRHLFLRPIALRPIAGLSGALAAKTTNRIGLMVSALHKVELRSNRTKRIVWYGTGVMVVELV